MIQVCRLEREPSVAQVWDRVWGKMSCVCESSCRTMILKKRHCDIAMYHLADVTAVTSAAKN